ncbi:unnamed protein product [Aspergillus oryzae]|uniref:Unnamed protein product n=2 Tax=Aspergillus oryzae TaxID=5062 RepID=A0AAN4YM66_ASPOZ|nr:unnamed protein product [Aspergillus oryzae]GMF91761.1 unnamed protein product [Aspergillus oryzae]GMG04924.1 unnamed protein product [Aspergillus oryzae]GMG32014.1 unnamed protein product [Aspergillus oryzae]GMG51194.1 unnamed protein product [Aspergillus oryzae var. brunneus]
MRLGLVGKLPGTATIVFDATEFKREETKNEEDERLEQNPERIDGAAGNDVVRNADFLDTADVPDQAEDAVQGPAQEGHCDD